MGFFYLTNITLDILWGVTWWVLKKTRKGVYYVLHSEQKTPVYLKNNPKKLLIDLKQQNERQSEQIAILTNKIELINNYITKIP
tara:strand:+ start:719 stop:970 length:252 start_codon:yes stop_codon:yes gene_type:complete